MDQKSQIHDWSPIPTSRYRQAQEAELGYWSLKDRQLLSLRAKCAFYAGYYEWSKHRALCDPFGVRDSEPDNFQISAEGHIDLAVRLRQPAGKPAASL